MSIAYVIWNVKPQLVDFGNFEIRYYSMLFALGFITGYIILARIFRNKGLNPEMIDKLTIYMVVSTIIGARLGHTMFYEFDYYIHHPLEIFLPWQGTLGEDFRFTGFQGLASHGAAIGILIGIYLFSRKNKMSYLWVMDMIVLVTALAGAFIRTGNLMNSEIYGKPTHSTYGFVFTHDLTRLLDEQYRGNIRSVSYNKAPGEITADGYVPLEINVVFDRGVNDEMTVTQFGDYVLQEDLSRYDFDGNVKMVPGDSITYEAQKTGNGYRFTATLLALPRHPSQIYEAMSYFLIFLLLLLIYKRYEPRLRDGFMFGIFLTLVFIARFFIEFLKADQEAFEAGMALNMGQILSIPFVIIGIIFVIYRWPGKTVKNEISEK